MKRLVSSLLIACGFVATVATGVAQVPQLLNYQGRVTVGSTNFDGAGQFKFALVNSNGTFSFWSNDGTSAGGSQPTAAVNLTVVRGLYSVLLGDSTIAGMTLALPATVFTNGDVRLRVWFNDGTTGFQQFTPDQRIAAVGYALIAANVPDGVITSNKLAAGAINGSKIADGTITSSKLAPNTVTSSNISDTIALGQTNVSGRLDVYRTAANTPSITLFGNGSQISTYGSDGLEQARLYGSSWGQLLLYNSLPSNDNAVDLSANNSLGGFLSLKASNGVSRAYLNGANSGGTLTLYQSDGSTGAYLSSAGTMNLYNSNSSIRATLVGNSSGSYLTLYQADGGTGISLDGDYSGYGRLTLNRTNGSARAYLYGGPSSGSLSLHNGAGNLNFWAYSYNDSEGVVSVRNSSGNETVYLWGRDSNGSQDGQIGLKKSSGTETVTIQAGEGVSGGAQMLMRNLAGVQTIQLDADASGVHCGYLGLYDSNGVATIILDANGSGDGKITTQVLQITGGSDLSENFDIRSVHTPLKPGMIVCIDPDKPGELLVSSKAYDRTVAGIVSGAGGVRTGMLMGQPGTKADGKHPVALTGRVYCYVDADASGAVEPGDLITTSATPGHGMKVKDHAKANGAIIGKAMSKLSSGKGLVLVLVSLQ